jgi:phospholipid-transporting ATPase
MMEHDSTDNEKTRKKGKSTMFNLDHSNNLNEKILNENLDNPGQNKSIFKHTSKRRETKAFLNRINIFFGPHKTSENFLTQNQTFADNHISTTKYTPLTWFPKSLLMQFKRIANIYFLLISILSCLKLSPKNPTSQIFTFILVLMFSMVKEAIEDYRRYKMDKEINNKITKSFNYDTKSFEQKLWQELRVGDLVLINKDDALPADLLLVKSALKSGLSFVDTKDLDGETNLKEKMVYSEINKMSDEEILSMEGSIQIDAPNEYLDSWEGNLHLISNKLTANVTIKNMLLKGSILRNTEFIYGMVIYSGHNTKIMKNAKSPPLKMSNLMRVMNRLLLSVFLFLVIIALVFSLMNFMFTSENNQYIEIYISIKNNITLTTLIQKFFTFIVAYSHLIPISLYVALEVVKLFQSWLIFYDELIFDYNAGKPAQARTSELIEELGQVEFIFSDKTGTLTQNMMEFKKYFTGSKIYGDSWDNNKHLEQDLEALQLLKIPGIENLNQTFEEISCDSEKKKLIQFFSVLSICHSSIAEKSKENYECNPQNLGFDSIIDSYKYSSSSPDEVALISGARKMGFVFTNRTTDTIEIYNAYSKQHEVWELLNEIPFDSNRKRMTVCVKKRGDLNNVVYILSKGADNIMLPLLKENEEVLSKANGKN